MKFGQKVHCLDEQLFSGGFEILWRWKHSVAFHHFSHFQFAYQWKTIILETALLTKMFSIVLVSGLVCWFSLQSRQDKTRQLYLTRVAQSAARLVSLGALHGFNKTYIYTFTITLQGEVKFAKITGGEKKKKKSDTMSFKKSFGPKWYIDARINRFLQNILFSYFLGAFLLQ